MAADENKIEQGWAAQGEQTDLSSVNTDPGELSFRVPIAEDFRTNGSTLMSCGFWVLFVHRFGNWRFDVRNPFFRLPLNIVYRLLYDFVRFFFGIHLCCTVPVGRRLNLLHHGGMYLGARRIGNDVLLKHNTTLGYKIGDDPEDALPVIEDHVEVGVGAVILGDVTVGQYSFVAANSLVLKDVPPHSIAMGVPARTFKKLDE